MSIPGLAAELRPHQIDGVRWLADRRTAGLGSVLADDMGLGKTVQVLALHALRRHSSTRTGGPTLVVAPTSVVGPWVDEAHRLVPGVVVHRYHGARRSLGSVGPGDLVVTSYGTARTDRRDLAAVPWDLVVADEAHHLADSTSRTSLALRSLGPAPRIALTGTPVQNRLLDLWSVVDWAAPGHLGTRADFERRHARPVERGGRVASRSELTAAVGEVLLRRTKDDVATDLPPTGRREHRVELTAEQRLAYQVVVDQHLPATREHTGPARRGRVLAMLTALKRVCNHPAHLGWDGPLRGRSGKFDKAVELVRAANDAGEAMVVVSQYTATLELLARALAEELGEMPPALVGSLPPSRRQHLVHELQAGRVPVLLLSLRAGGTGLTLTGASQLVHVDRWWNPAVEDQATDRIRRIGQVRATTIHHLVTTGTVEERIGEVLATKRTLAAGALPADDGGGHLVDLDDEALGQLVALGH